MPNVLDIANRGLFTVIFRDTARSRVDGYGEAGHKWTYLNSAKGVPRSKAQNNLERFSAMYPQYQWNLVRVG